MQNETMRTKEDIPEGQVFGLTPPMEQSMMGGFTRIDQDSSGLIRVHYSDGTREERDGSGEWDLLAQHGRECFSLFRVLSWVQEGR
tara:strand:+ start:521 stop:778 length:258 start_codon:yes stop_codon:yes gene_type:complete